MAAWSSSFEKIMHARMLRSRRPSDQSKRPSYEIQHDKQVAFRYYLTCQCLPLLPSYRFRIVWDLTAMAMLFYDTIFIPMQVFDMPRGDFSVVGLLDIVCVIFWTLDMPLNFLVGYYTKDGQPVMSLHKIALRYCRGWLLLDFLIVFNDWMTLSMRWGGNDDRTEGGAGLARLGKIVRVVRGLRTLRLLRLMKLRELMSYVYELIDSEWVGLMLGTLVNVILLVCVNHGFACIWFWVGSADTPGETWLKKYGFTDAVASWEDQYVAAMHWSLTQFTSASTQVTATNGRERLFSVIVVLFAVVAFSSFLSSITSAMTRLRTINSHAVTQTINLKKFLKQNKISRDLSTRVTRYVHLVQIQHETYLHENKVLYLQLLSGPLNVELQWERYMHVLKPHPFFEEASHLGRCAMQHLCFTALSTSLLARQDVLFDAGVECESMYFPKSGWLFYKRVPGFKRTPRYALVGKGQWFCENAMWTPWMHHGLMKALIEIAVVALNVNKFQNTALAHPDVFKLSCARAHDFVAEMNSPHPMHPYLWDIPADVMYPDTNRMNLHQHLIDVDEVIEAFDREAQLVDMEYSRHRSDFSRYGSNGNVRVTRPSEHRKMST